MTTIADGLAALRPANGERPDAQQVRALAMQFESLLIGTLLKEMRESSDSDKSSAENAPLFGSIDTEFAMALSRAGGFGLTDRLADDLGSRFRSNPSTAVVASGVGTTPGVVAETAVVAKRPETTPEVDFEAPVGRVSSGFGWRRDPMKGDRAFHHGTDIAMPVGQDVGVAGAGKVTFAGEQGGYGLTVVVQHPDGLETRYAHLSAVLVNAGDTVAKGQAVAKSGNSGKSTGPHLHFEVRRNGQPVDPAGLE